MGLKQASRAAMPGAEADEVRSLGRYASMKPGRVRVLEHQLAAIMEISRTVSEGHALDDTLSEITETAGSLVRSSAVALILRRVESASGLSVVAATGLSKQFTEDLNHGVPIELGHGPTGLAAHRRRPVTVNDTLTDPIFKPWRAMAIRESFRSLVSVPLMTGRNRRVIGAMNAYRAEPGSWKAGDIGLLETLADHAAIAIQTAQLLEESRRQVHGLSLLVRSLRTQGHEHSNLIHALQGLLSLGEIDEALDLIAGVNRHSADLQSAMAGSIDNAVISGFLSAEAAVVRNSGILLTVDPSSQLTELPHTVTELDAITVIGNLVQNAVEAVSANGTGPRTVSITIRQSPQFVDIAVADNGPGVTSANKERILSPGYTTKPDHVGIGLSLVNGIVTRSLGTIAIDDNDGGGTRVSVRIPNR